MPLTSPFLHFVNGPIPTVVDDPVKKGIGPLGGGLNGLDEVGKLVADVVGGRILDGIPDLPISTFEFTGPMERDAGGFRVHT